MRSAMLFLILSLALVLNPSVSMAGKFEEVSSLSSEPVLKVREFEDGEAAQAILEMSAFLKRQATIRVLISEAPGNGHQIAAVRLMRRLRELGFEGEFEVLFDPKVAERLRFLIPGFRVDEADGLQRINSRILGKIVTVPTDKPGKLLRKQIELGFSAADDRMFSTELRSAMNVRTTVNLQPKNWNGRKSSHLVISGDTQTSIRHLKDLSVLNSPIPAEQLFDVIKDEMEASRSALKTPGILKLIENIDSIDLLPGYSNYIRADAPNIIEKTVKALLEAKAIAPERFTRPIIIPLMTDLQALKVTTEKIISRLGVASIDITEAGKLEQAIAGLGQPITIVHIGPIPPVTFEAVFERTTLPALIEGKNLTNIMQDLGLPFVNVLGSRNDLYLDPLDRQLDLLTLDAFRWYAHVDDSPADRARQRVALTDFYVRASNPDSSVSQMFQATRLDPNTTREKVFQSLLIAKDLITAREAAEAAQRSTTNSLVESVRNGVRSVVRSCNLYLQSRSAAR